MQHHVIDIPAGTTRVLVFDIPKWISEKLLTAVDTEPTLLSLAKKVRISGENLEFKSLNAEDWKLLNKIWQDLLPIENTTYSKFQLCKEAFASSPLKPDWELLETFDNPRGEYLAKKMGISVMHSDRLNAALNNGSLAALTATRVSASKIAPGVTISLDDAKAYLLPLEFSLRETILDLDESKLVTSTGVAQFASNRRTPPAFVAEFIEFLKLIKFRADEKGLNFDSEEMPGRKKDLHAIARNYSSEFRLAESTFDDYLKGLCKFKKGARESNFYSELLPECYQSNRE